MYGVTVSELWNGSSGFSQVSIIAAIILALYVITKKGFLLYTAAIIFVLGIISVDKSQGNPIGESVGALVCLGGIAVLAHQIYYGLGGKIWSIIAIIVGISLSGYADELLNQLH